MASWQVWALLSAVFAALTAIFAKIGVADINPDAATLIRTAVILVALTLVVAGTRELPSLVGAPARTYTFLVLSGLATGASWWCYFRALHVGDAARVAPLDKLSVVLVALLLIYEHSLVKHDDLSRVNAAFFTMNGFISMGFLLFVAADLMLMR